LIFDGHERVIRAWVSIEGVKASAVVAAGTNATVLVMKVSAAARTVPASAIEAASAPVMPAAVLRAAATAAAVIAAARNAS